MNLRSCCSQKQSSSAYHRLAKSWPAFSPSLTPEAEPSRAGPGRLGLLSDRTTNSCLFVVSRPEPGRRSASSPTMFTRTCVGRSGAEVVACQKGAKPGRGCVHGGAEKPARSRLSPASEEVGSEQRVLGEAGHAAWTPVSSFAHR